MDKRGVLNLSGFASLLAGLIWMACRVIPLVWYRFDHPKMTETELFIYSLSIASWWDLCPGALIIYGFLMIPKK